MTTSAPAVKAALVSTLSTLYAGSPAVLVTYGLPDGNNQPDEIVGVLDQRLVVERPVMSTRRPREEAVQTAVLISVYRSGPDTQQAATERAWALYDLLAEHFRTKPNEELGGACRDAWVSEGALVEGKVRAPDGSGLVLGRTADITALVTSSARLT